jgi:predicted small metal-binding protein
LYDYIHNLLQVSGRKASLAENGKGGARMRAVLCALLCNCRHALRADDDERLVGVALDHLRRYHPVAPLREELVKEIVTARAYEIEYTAVYPGNLRTEEF